MNPHCIPLAISLENQQFTKVRAAAIAVFDLADASPNLQMLWDVRSVFREKNNSEYLPTSDLLSELRKMESRPWSAWGPKSGRRIATLLHPFGIFPRRLLGADKDLRGYFISDLQDAFERYLLFSSSAELDETAAVRGGNDACGGMKIASATASTTTISAIGAD